MSRIIALAIAALLPATALATPPNACELLKPEEINLIAAKKVERVQLQKSGNPSECGFLEGSRVAVVTVNVREVQYAVKDGDVYVSIIPFSKDVNFGKDFYQ